MRLLDQLGRPPGYAVGHHRAGAADDPSAVRT